MIKSNQKLQWLNFATNGQPYTRLAKVTGFKLPEDDIMFSLIFSSLLLSIIISNITKSLEYAILLFCLLIVQKGLTILFIFDDG